MCPMQIINDNNTLLTVATANLLNLALPNRSYYENRDPYKPVQYEEKCNWLGAQFARLDADVLAVQEVWDADALKYAVKQSGLHYSSVLVPGAEDGAQGTPRVGLVTRLPVKQVHSIDLFDERVAVEQRLDIRAARRNLDAEAEMLGLTRVTRWVNVLHIEGIREHEADGSVKRGFEIGINIPLFDWGDAQ